MTKRRRARCLRLFGSDFCGSLEVALSSRTAALAVCWPADGNPAGEKRRRWTTEAPLQERLDATRRTSFGEGIGSTPLPAVLHHLCALCHTHVGGTQQQ